MTEPERVPINVVIGEPTTIAVTATNAGPAATGVCLVVATAFIKVEQFVDAEVRGGRFSDWAPTAPYAGAYNLASLALDQLNFAEGESGEVQFRFTLAADIEPREVDGDASLRTSLGSPDVLGDKGLMHLVITAPDPSRPTLTGVSPASGAATDLIAFTGENFAGATLYVQFQENNVTLTGGTPDQVTDTSFQIMVQQGMPAEWLNKPLDVVLLADYQEVSRLPAALTFTA